MMNTLAKAYKAYEAKRGTMEYLLTQNSKMAVMADAYKWAHHVGQFVESIDWDKQGKQAIVTYAGGDRPVNKQKSYWDGSIK